MHCKKIEFHNECKNAVSVLSNKNEIWIDEKKPQPIFV